MRSKFVAPLLGPVELPLYRVAAACGLGLGRGVRYFDRSAGLWPAGEACQSADSRSGARGDASVSRAASWPKGLLWTSYGWILLGASQLAVVRAFDPGQGHVLRMLGLAPVVIASVALATVAGFVVAVLPGGLGVREGVLMSTLAPVIGSDQAVVASLALRLVWVAAELVAAAAVFPWLRRPPADVAPSKPKPTSFDQA